MKFHLLKQLLNFLLDPLFYFWQLLFICSSCFICISQFIGQLLFYSQLRFYCWYIFLFAAPITLVASILFGSCDNNEDLCASKLRNLMGTDQLYFSCCLAPLSFSAHDFIRKSLSLIVNFYLRLPIFKFFNIFLHVLYYQRT